MKNAIATVYAGWNQNRFNNLIFFEFIEKERNSVIKEYKISRAVEATVKTSKDEIPELLHIGDKAFDPEEVAYAAIQWWEGQLDIIEDMAARNKVEEKHGAKQRGHR